MPWAAAWYLSTFVGLQFGGDTSSCLGRGADGATIGLQGRVLHVESEVATTVGITAVTAVTALGNVTLGPPGRIRPYVLAGVGMMAAAEAGVPTDVGLAWGIGGGLEVSRGTVGLRLDVRAIDGPFRFGRVTVGVVVRSKAGE